MYNSLKNPMRIAGKAAELLIVAAYLPNVSHTIPANTCTEKVRVF
jgi:hypothetical protein